jgi:DNA helicase-2/ATP-dependent DNA helicase PcrA
MSSQELIEKILSGCTAPQREAIQQLSGPLLVLAGPGSGKTRVITRRVAHLVASGCRPDDILAITFTNKAAGEMRERIEALGVPPGVWVSTFHSFCARMLRIYADRVGLSRSFTIYDSADSVAAVKRAMAELQIDSTLFTPSYAARVISTAKNRLWGAEKLQESGAPEEAFAIGKVFERYERLLRGANAADFDDLLILMVRLLREVPETRERLSRRFLHVLVDEYQDTNHAQYLIAKHLAGAGNLCVTGDPDQSIYGWRGADVNNILEFERDYPDARLVRLEQNYRSTQRILQAADRLIAHNVERKAKSLWTENPEGEPVRLLRFGDEQEEADAVAADLAELFREGRAVPRDAAIFYRLNSQSRVLESALRGEAIPYSIVAGTEFYQRREIKDLLSYLRLVDNPADDVGVERVANIPARRIGDTSLQRLREWGSARGLTLFEALANAAEAGVRGPALQGIAEFRRLTEQLRALPRRPVAGVLERLLAATGYERYLAAAGDNAEERIENVRELVNAAAEYDQAEPEGGLQGFLEQAALVSDVDLWDEKLGGVTLMTLHAAKGLEFPVICIVGLEDGLLPLLRENGDYDLEEERRLFFVGLTRAKRRLTLSYAESRARHGKRQFTEPSRFIRELPEEIAAAEQSEYPPRRSFPSAFRTPHTAFRTPHSAFRTPHSSVEPRRVRRSEHEEIVYDGDYSSDAAPLDPRAPFRAGDSVRHPRYGIGRVVDVSGYGEDLRATVHFQTVGVKRLVLKFAGLRKL